MENLVFAPDDSRLGKFNAEGGYESWPTADAFGKPYERHNATVRRIKDTQNFIVVGPDQDKDIDTILVERRLPSAPKTDK